MSTLFFYTKDQFFNFKSTQMATGFEFLSMSKLLSSQKIDELDEYQQYYVDISSMVGFVKANDSQLCSSLVVLGKILLLSATRSMRKILNICSDIYLMIFLMSRQKVMNHLPKQKKSQILSLLQ